MVFAQGGAGHIIAPRLIACRVDALYCAYRLALGDAVRDELLERQSIADEAGRAALHLGSATYELKRSRRQHVIAFRNADLRGTYDPMATAGWVLELIVHAVFLARHPLETAISLVERVASDFGAVHEQRLRRFDLCGDYAGFVLRDDDAAARVLTTRARIGSFVSDSKDVDEVSGETCGSNVREFRDASRVVTGLTIAAGGPLMARIYDKLAELSLSNREHKRGIEYARWRANGWSAGEGVVRVEFQHRGPVLDQMGLRDVRRLPAMVDPAWTYDTKWLRLIVPGSASRPSRCALDPRWDVVRRTVFRHEAGPLERQRLRGDGARPSHVRGAALSMIGAHGELPLVGITNDGEALSEGDFADSMTAEQQESWVRLYYERIGHEAGRAIARDELLRHGARGALVRAVAQNYGTIARFSSIDDARPHGSGR